MARRRMSKKSAVPPLKNFNFWIAILVLIGLLVTVLLVNQRQELRKKAQFVTPSVYYGAWVPGVPRNMTYLATFEADVGKPVAILHWYQGWGVTDGTQYFQTTWMNNVRNHGAIPMITWEPWDYTKGVNQPAYSLAAIINGNYDAYITKWAQDSKTWGHPYFLRFAHEMNVPNYPWSENINGNQPGQYILAWKHVRDIFTANGVTNITWVWSPNIEYSGTIPFENIYPGDAYVDWLGADGYNGGTALPWGGWQSFPQLFSATYNHFLRLASTKPIMVAETASVEAGGSKPDWIKDVYQTQLPTYFPQIKAILWFNENREADWRVESSLNSQSAFTQAVAPGFYASNYYADLNISPIPIPANVPYITPTSVSLSPSPSPMPTPTSSVVDTTPPLVNITAPLNGSTVSGKARIGVSATDNIGVAKVEIYIDSKLAVTDTAIPYEYYWNTNRKGITVGIHSIRAVASDVSGNSSSFQISVYKR